MWVALRPVLGEQLTELPRNRTALQSALQPGVYPDKIQNILYFKYYVAQEPFCFICLSEITPVFIQTLWLLNAVWASALGFFAESKIARLSWKNSAHCLYSTHEHSSHLSTGGWEAVSVGLKTTRPLAGFLAHPQAPEFLLKANSGDKGRGCGGNKMAKLNAEAKTRWCWAVEMILCWEKSTVLPRRRNLRHKHNGWEKTSNVCSQHLFKVFCMFSLYYSCRDSVGTFRKNTT